jgi:hypothetical protein
MFDLDKVLPLYFLVKHFKTCSIREVVPWGNPQGLLSIKIPNVNRKSEHVQAIHAQLWEPIALG